MKSKINLFWYRRDLRLHDNTALYHALNSGKKVQCVFIFDTNILDKLTDKSDARVVFIHQQLDLLNSELNKHGGSLLTLYDDPTIAWERLIKEYDIDSIYANDDYEPYARNRDTQIQQLALKNNISFNLFKDHVIFEKNEVVKDDGKPYTVFTPYKNKYLKQLTSENYTVIKSEKMIGNIFPTPAQPIHSLKNIGFNNLKFNFPDKIISENILDGYGSNRDFPGLDATSKLSVHLRFGTISIRQLFRHTIKLNSMVYLNELIWRDFYQMILWNFPHVQQNAFKPVYDRIPWRNNEDEFQKWCEGSTGYPIVDAGMRELNSTGFMHNRVRMITASFLVKHLLIDWRWGEHYFARKLLDFDLASNNGGWQWAAGSGCDAAPYFRIFNPYEQTRKFDPELKYIRKWIPELEELSYPSTIVEHKFARERCLTVYKKALNEKA